MFTDLIRCVYTCTIPVVRYLQTQVPKHLAPLLFSHLCLSSQLWGSPDLSTKTASVVLDIAFCWQRTQQGDTSIQTRADHDPAVVVWWLLGRLFATSSTSIFQYYTLQRLIFFPFCSKAFLSPGIPYRLSSLIKIKWVEKLHFTLHILSKVSLQNLSMQTYISIFNL